MSVLVLGIGALVLFYCSDYFHHHDGHTEKRLPSFAAELVAFSGAMFGLVVSDNMLVLYVFWELTTVLSFLLVGHYAERATSRRAATQALLVTTFGGLAMLVGIVMLGNASGTYLLSELIAAPPTGPGGIGRRSAGAGRRAVQVGDRADALLAARRDGRADTGQRVPARRRDGQGRRLSGRADDARLRRLATVAADGRRSLGVLTMLLAGWRAVREYDLKLILAFGTVSQLGLITVMVGAGGGDLMLAGLAMLCAHAMFKAALFMVVGVIDHATGTRDIRGLAWLGQRSRPLLVIAVGATASMAALPPFLGFVAKEADFETLAHGAVTRRRGALRARRHRARVRCSPPSTACDSFWGAFAPQGTTRTQHAGGRNAPPPASFPDPARRSWPRRAWCSACGRPAGRRAGRLRRHGTRRRRTTHLALWHGVDLPLLLSVVVLAVGAAAFFGRDRLRRLRHRPPAARQRRPHLRRRAARPRPRVGAAYRLSPSAVRSRPRSR